MKGDFTMPGRRPLLLFGGGLDSCAMVEFYALHNPVLLYFEYGQKAQVGELRALEYFAKKHKLESHIVSLPTVIPASPLTTEEVVTEASDHAKNYIPGRNLLFGAIAYSYAARRHLAPILLGASPAPADSVFNDAKTDFQLKFNELVDFAYPEEATWLFLPLVTGVRREYLARALIREPDLFKIAFTCYESRTEKECGVCVHCQQKADLAKQLNAKL